METLLNLFCRTSDFDLAPEDQEAYVDPQVDPQEAQVDPRGDQVDPNLDPPPRDGYTQGEIAGITVNILAFFKNSVKSTLLIRITVLCKQNSFLNEIFVKLWFDGRTLVSTELIFCLKVEFATKSEIVWLQVGAATGCLATSWACTWAKNRCKGTKSELKFETFTLNIINVVVLFF